MYQSDELEDRSERFYCGCEEEYEYEFADQEEDVYGNEFGYGCYYKDECGYEQDKENGFCQCCEINRRKIEEEYQKSEMEAIMQYELRELF